MPCKEYRNLLYSLVDYLIVQLPLSGWSGISVVKGFTQAYKTPLPNIAIEVGEINSEIITKEIGSTSYLENIPVAIRIFADKEELRKDLANWLTEKIMPGISYYEYTVVNGAVSVKTLKGRIRIMRVIDNRKELTNVENLELSDKHRHILSFTCRIALS